MILLGLQIGVKGSQPNPSLLHCQGKVVHDGRPDIRFNSRKKKSVIWWVGGLEMGL